MIKSLLEIAQNELDALNIEVPAMHTQLALKEKRRVELAEWIRVSKTIGVASQSIQDETRTQLSNLSPAIWKSTKDGVIAIAEKLLSGGKRMHTREILAELLKQDIHIGGKDTTNQVLHVSSILNKSGIFSADRSTGWALKEEESSRKPARPQFLASIKEYL